MSLTTLPSPRPPVRVPRSSSTRTSSTGVLILKIAALAALDALVVYAAIVLFLDSRWLVASASVAGAIAITWLYLRPGLLPAKYLVPGTVFLLIFQVYVIIFSAYIAFTNYGDGHVGSKDDAIAVITSKSLTRVEGSPAYDMAVLERDGNLAFLVTGPDGEALVGDEESPLRAAPNADFEHGRAVALPGYTTLGFEEILADQERIAATSIPMSDDPADGALRTPDGAKVYLYTATMTFDEASDTFTDSTTGVVYSDTGQGAFVSPDGQEIMPGWKIDVGFDNFARAFTDKSIRGPLLSVLVWTFVFAGVTVAGTFAIGVFLALTLDDPRLRFRRTFRALAILPYAFPAFLSALIWSGLLNSQFGFVNQVLLGGAQVPWLTDPLLAKVSILVVNLWLGYPYMFLVATGALQSIPGEYIEAARVDGAGPWTLFRAIKLPLLMVSMAPLLIAAFAFNFNNFNVIYMLTEGGPQDISTEMNVGATDILITLVYKVAFGETSGRDYGLASAFAIIVFVLVGLISVVSFRRTRALEDLH